MNEPMRHFHIGDVLTVTTETLVSPRLMAGVYDILGFMTGEKLFTHQLPRAQEVCAPELLRQHPQLSKVDADRVNRHNWKHWLAKQEGKFGLTFAVSPLPADAYEPKDPLSELEEMVPPEKIIVLEKGSD